jgi:intracellular sulfur oxidation DsrE/DsrF family protein
MNDRNDSDSQRLNAFVDRELDDAEQEAMLSAIERDPRKRIELSDLYHLKEMVRTAYSDDKGYTTGRSLDRLGISGSIAASILLLAAVFAGGYQAGNWSGYSAEDVFHLSQSQAESGRVMLYVSTDDDAKFRQTLDQAEVYLDNYRDQGINVLVVTSAEGINLLRKSMTPYQQRIDAMKASYGESLDFVACNNTILNLRNRGIDVDLVNSAEVAPSAVQYVVDRLKEGWTYIAI